MRAKTSALFWIKCCGLLYASEDERFSSGVRAAELRCMRAIDERWHKIRLNCDSTAQLILCQKFKM